MTSLRHQSLLGLCLVLLLSVCISLPTAQTQQPAPALVIEGGTLIDGNGGAPLVDYVIFDDGSVPLEWARVGFEEAARAGKPVFTRAYGPVMFPEDAARLGSAALPHSAGVGIAVTQDPSKWAEGRDDRNELDRFAEMDEGEGKGAHRASRGARSRTRADLRHQFSRLSEGLGSFRRRGPAALYRSRSRATRTAPGLRDSIYITKSRSWPMPASPPCRSFRARRSGRLKCSGKRISWAPSRPGSWPT